MRMLQICEALTDFKFKKHGGIKMKIQKIKKKCEFCRDRYTLIDVKGVKYLQCENCGCMIKG